MTIVLRQLASWDPAFASWGPAFASWARHLPAEMVSGTAAQTPVPHAPGARMTVVTLTPSNYTDTQLLYRHPTTIQTPNYYTETRLVYRHPTGIQKYTGKRELNCKRETKRKRTNLYIYIYTYNYIFPYI